MMSLNEELQTSQGTIVGLKTSMKEVTMTTSVTICLIASGVYWNILKIICVCLALAQFLFVVCILMLLPLICHLCSKG